MRAKLLTTVLRKGGAAASPLLTGLVGYWKLDEVSDGSAPVTRLDSVGTAHLTDYNTTPSGAGHLGTCAMFDGTIPEYLRTGNTTAFCSGDADFMVALWVMCSNTGVNKWMLGVENLAWGIGLHPGNSAWACQIAGFGLVGTGGPLNLNAWTLITLKFDHTADKLWARTNNGAAVSTATGASFPAAGTSQLKIGVSNPASPFSGGVQNVGYWNRLLTDDEEAILWNGGDGLTYPF